MGVRERRVDEQPLWQGERAGSGMRAGVWSLMSAMASGGKPKALVECLFTSCKDDTMGWSIESECLVSTRRLLLLAVQWK